MAQQVTAVLAAQTQGPKFGSEHDVKSQVWPSVCHPSALQGNVGGSLGLTGGDQSSFRFSEKPCLKEIRCYRTSGVVLYS